ncbi:UNVERIFIED_CONTAM: putative protein phosphatase 2C 80 [Sesamum calycinum]|uniref:Protein phosphatase n=1 Tax=Sesamum calycinum TaxID=2727403 RepID=A0AAW2MPN9_9LAMI
MPSGLLSNLNVAFGFGFPRAGRLKQSQPLHLIEALFSGRSPSGAIPGSAGEVLRYSSTRGARKIMAASGSMVASGDLVVDALVSSCGNVSGFVKPGGVFFSDRSYRICRSARVSMRSGGMESHHGPHGCLVFDFEPRYNNSGPVLSKGLSKDRAFSSSCYSNGDRALPEVSTDGSLSAEQLSSLAISVEQRSPNHSVLKLLSGACYLPHPAKEETGGEDAHFICADEQVIGVADGVGGWADVGVNAGEYARELMSNSVKAIREVADDDVDPLRVLEKAHASTKAMGSSTACIIALKNQDLHAINLGDSGFMIVRDGRTFFESPVQQHGFNFTYQLERGNRGDLPSSGQVFKISVVPGDVVVAGSDGLFDNLYSKEVAAIVVDALEEGLSPDATAEKIAAFARLRAVDRKHRTPFSTAAQEAGFSYYGGKLDDLTVVVSYVSTSANA